MAKCEWCGSRFSKAVAEEIFEEEAFFWYFSYKKIRPCLCGNCAIKAVFEDQDEGVYFDTCEECGKEFDLGEEEYLFRTYTEKFGGASLRDYWDEKVLCAGCALEIFNDKRTEDTDKYLIKEK